MATTHNATGLDQFVAQSPAWGTSGDGFGRFSVMKFHVDMAAIAAELGAVIDGSASDVIQLWDIPAGTHILSVMVKVTTAEGATATDAVGDGDSAAGFLAAFSINGLAQKMTLTSDAYGATCGRTYAATDTLDLTFATAADIDVAVFDVYVSCIFYG
jgi:hypothetical protein